MTDAPAGAARGLGMRRKEAAADGHEMRRAGSRAGRSEPPMILASRCSVAADDADVAAARRRHDEREPIADEASPSRDFRLCCRSPRRCE